VGRSVEDALALLEALQSHEGFEGAFLNGWTKGRDGVDISCTVRYEPKGHPSGSRSTLGASPLRKADQLSGQAPSGRQINFRGRPVSANGPFWRKRLLPAFLVLLGLNLVVLAGWTGPRYCGSATPRRARSGAPRGERQRAAVAALRERPGPSAGTVRTWSGSTGASAPEEADLLPTLEAIEDMARAPGLQPGRAASSGRR